jgi:hypothetical protein
MDTTYGYPSFQSPDPNLLFENAAGNTYQKCDQKTNPDEFITSPNGMIMFEAEVPSPSNSAEVLEKSIQTKYTFQELDFNLFHNQDNLNADAFRRHQYQIHVNQSEELAEYTTENGEITLQNSRKYHQNLQKYETKLIFKQSSLQSPENEENVCPKYLNHNETDTNDFQIQFPQPFREELLPFPNNTETHSQAQVVASFDNVNDAIIFQADGSEYRQQVTVDDIKSVPVCQEDDLLVAAETLGQRTAAGEEEFTHPQISASPHGLGEFTHGKFPLCTRIWKLIIYEHFTV